MLVSIVTAVVRICTRFPWVIIALGLVAAVVSGSYSATHFAINTDINKLISPKLDWREREAAFEKAFPGHFGSTLVVVDAPTVELAAQASAALARRLAGEKDLFHSVQDTRSGEFFARNGLLFLPLDTLRATLDGLKEGAPLIQDMASDMSLRGLVDGDV